MTKIFIATILCWVFVRAAEAQQGSEALRHAIALSDSGEWEQAVTALQHLLDSGGLSQEEQTTAWKILGLTYLSLGRRDQAVIVYKAMVRHNASLDMTVLGEEAPVEAIRCVGQAVMEVRHEEIERRRAQLRRVSRGGAVLRSTILPGWGQRYQGATGRGYLMAGLTVASATSATMAQRAYRQARQQYRDASTGSDFDALFDRSERKGNTANRAWRLVGGIWLLNIVDAILQGPNLTGPDVVITTPTPSEGVHIVYRTRF
jgi:tetratricopeptide (TPR) repeat protein